MPPHVPGLRQVGTTSVLLDSLLFSLRHFMITQRIMSGLNFKQIADMCGTSVMQIERTYYHLNDEIRLTNALADYKRNDDGTIEPI